MHAHRVHRRSSVHRTALAAFTLLVGLLALIAPGAAASADVNDFSYSSWESTYDVSLDEDGRAVAHVTETLVAEFPDFDQNKGIVRGYNERYDRADLDIEIVSVKDADGNPVPYDTDRDDGTLFVLTGDDDYVQGTQTYVIESTMRDFMTHGTDTERDEFYWNLLPMTSTQSIGRFHAEVNFSPELADALTGHNSCYDGQYGSTEDCDVVGPLTADGGATFTIDSGERAPGAGVTVAIGFEAGTVTQPPARGPNLLADWGSNVLGVITIITSFLPMIAVAATRRRKRKATGIVVAQFDVPPELSPLAASPMLPKKPNPIPSEIVHLAVNGVLRLEESDDDKRPMLRLLDENAAQDPLDILATQELFPGQRDVRKIPKSDNAFGKQMRQLAQRGLSKARQNGWLAKQKSPAAVALAWVSLALMVATGLLFLYSLFLNRESFPLTIPVAVSVLVIAPNAFGYGFRKHEMHTRRGAEVYEYLLGVKEFIQVAETDRLRMLQSYEGAERRSDGTVDVVHLYEKLLPYAMLFGEEKSWGKVLEMQYAQSDPVWISTRPGVPISSQISGYSSQMHSAASYTPPSSSGSSSGGSGGGGFSGGGGGGGFSGGR